MLEQIKKLHATFCRITGQELKYQFCERLLFDYLNSGFTEAELENLLNFMIHQNRKREPKFRERILFHKLLSDLEVLNSRIAESNAWHRNKRPAPTAKAKVVSAFRNEPAQVEQVGTTRHISEVFQAIPKPPC